MDMEMVYMICAAVGGTLIVCQFLVTLLGLGGHHDMGGGHEAGGHDMAGHDTAGHDASGHHEPGQESQPNWFFSKLTIRTLSAAIAFFGLAGLAGIRYKLDPIPGMVIAVGAGGLALFLVAWLMKLLTKFNVDGTIRIERAVGARGTVYLSVPGSRAGAGKVHVNLLNRTLEYKAITSQENLATGAKIIVVGIVNADTVEVAPAPESERESHV
jgi:hypothetical protein